MRFLPLLTALLVAVVIYGVIMERDALRAFANGGAEPETEQAENPDTITPADADSPVSVVVQRSVATTVDSGIVLAGRTEAARNVEVRSETSGLVISEPIVKGTSLKKGDLMCELDPGTRLATLAEARARWVEANNNNTTASRLAERGFSSETSAISSRAALESAQAMVEQAEKEVERLKILAPFDGLLESDTAELGTLLQPGGACGTLISLDPIRLVGFVPELDVEKVALGARAGARLSSGREVVGEVTFVSKSADPLTRTFRIEVEVPNADRSIRDGVSADILIALDGAKGHLLPQSALTLNDEGALGVRVNERGVARFIPVQVVRDDPRGLWLSGLPNEIDGIVIGQDFVSDGRLIAPTYREVTQ